MTTRWDQLADVRTRLRRRWDTGEFLTACSAGQPWQPLVIPLRGPTTADLAGRFDECRRWAQTWTDLPRRHSGMIVETKSIGARSIGANLVPTRLIVPGYDALWWLLGVQDEVARFAELYDATESVDVRLAAWMRAHPMMVLQQERQWPATVRTVTWLAATAGTGVYLREITVPGVDTKFIETHRNILAHLLDVLLPDDPGERTAPVSRFARRYGFADKPAYLRLRLLDPSSRLAGGLSEATIRVDEFTNVAPDVDLVYVVENEITYLALPAAPHAAVLLGGGYAVSDLAPTTWLTDRRVLYWGDLDTHGFAILNRLRSRLPSVQSMLMDRRTLLDHAHQWVREPSPTHALLDQLTDDEAALYVDLIEDRYGRNVRLEQERVNFDAVRQAMSEAGSTSPSRRAEQNACGDGAEQGDAARCHRLVAD